MELVALGLLVFGVALAEPVSRRLARARWPARDPVGALLLWQAIGLAGGLALLGAGLLYGLSPLGAPRPALDTALAELGAGRAPALDVPARRRAAPDRGAGRRGCSACSSPSRCARCAAGARHRELLDLLATPWPAAPGARVLEHPVPVAYCLPGLRSRLVVSAGVLDCLDVDQVWAVLAHERAHLRERHDLVVLPFVAWGATAPFVRGMVCAQFAVATLIEMRADDVAVRRASPAAALRGARRDGGSGARRRAELVHRGAAPQVGPHRRAARAPSARAARAGPARSRPSSSRCRSSRCSGRAGSTSSAQRRVVHKFRSAPTFAPQVPLSADVRSTSSAQPAHSLALRCCSQHLIGPDRAHDRRLPMTLQLHTGSRTVTIGADFLVWDVPCRVVLTDPWQLREAREVLRPGAHRAGPGRSRRPPSPRAPRRSTRHPPARSPTA